MPAVAGVLYGIKPAVVAIVLHAAWRIGSRALKHPALWVIAALAFVAIFAFVGAVSGDRARGRRRRRTSAAASRPARSAVGGGARRAAKARTRRR